MFEGVGSGGEGVEGAALDNLAEPVEVGNGVANGLRVVSNIVEAVRLQESVTRRRLVEEEQRHCNPKTEQ
ncbi:hypothetical protein GYH30_025368 [Glycine max]|nr:hypothetical protein GYH30_025368 [Glycine max]